MDGVGGIRETAESTKINCSCNGECWFHVPNVDETKELLLENENVQIQGIRGPRSAFQDEERESLGEDSSFSSQQSGTTVGSTVSYLQRIDPAIDHVSLYYLSDVGFRNIFSAIQFQPHPKIKSRVETDTTSLIDLAPSTFSPVYYTNISHRACFLPSIAKGIASLVSNTHSPVVKAKLQALEVFFREQQLLSLANPDSSAPNPGTKEIIKCFLWQTMQRGLRTCLGGCKLTPLDSTPSWTAMERRQNFNHGPLDGGSDISIAQHVQPPHFDEFDIEGDSEGEDGEMLTENEDPVISDPSLETILDDLSDASSSSSFIFLNPNDPPRLPIPTHAAPSPDMLSMQTSFPSSPILDTRELDELGLQLPSSSTEMLDTVFPGEFPRGFQSIDADVDLLL
ncbi:hypothetical protein VTO42DRAFT_8794 [Malbranchea cinnamomea]